MPTNSLLCLLDWTFCVASRGFLSTDVKSLAVANSGVRRRASAQRSLNPVLFKGLFLEQTSAAARGAALRAKDKQT